MDIPVAYVIFEIMIILKENNKDTSISTKTLIIFLKELIGLLDFDKEELEDLIFDFDFSNELSFFLSEYEDYFQMEENIITLDDDVSIDKLKYLIEEVTYNYDDQFIIQIYNIISNNYCFLEILGININTQVYDFMLKLEEELEKEYLDFCYYDLFYEEERYQKIKKIKLLKIIIDTMYINVNNSFDVVDNKNLLKYAKNSSRSMKDEERLLQIFDNPPFNQEYLLNNALDRAIFINEPVSKHVLSSKMETSFKKKNKSFNMDDMARLNFYLMYLKLLNNEINRVLNDDVKDELMITKYRLMYAIDSIYDLMNFNKEEEIININHGYGFIVPNVYFYAFEILCCSDSNYKINGTNDKNVIIYYFNIIKKLYIEAYYKLTGNENIINNIKNNSFYGVNKISTELFNSFIIDDNIKKKKRRKNYI